MRPLAASMLFLILGAAAPALPVAAAAALEREDARPLPFIADDYAKALGEARARALPLFIEAWAPW